LKTAGGGGEKGVKGVVPIGEHRRYPRYVILGFHTINLV
jgi:hypothetical protein